MTTRKVTYLITWDVGEQRFEAYSATRATAMIVFEALKVAYAGQDVEIEFWHWMTLEDRTTT